MVPLGIYFLLFFARPFFLTSAPDSLIAVSRRTAAAAVAEASMVADLMAAAIAGFVAAASMAARALFAQEVATKAAGWEPAAV